MSPRSFLNKKRRPRSNNSCVKPSRGGTRPELRGRRLDCLDKAKVQLKGPRWVLATKKMSLLLKELRAIIETSMAGVNDFIGLTNLKCCAPALLKGRMGNPVEHAGHISIGYTAPHLSALRVTRTASWWNIHSGCLVRGVYSQKGKRVVWGCSALSCKPTLEFVFII